MAIPTGNKAFIAGADISEPADALAAAGPALLFGLRLWLSVSSSAASRLPAKLDGGRRGSSRPGSSFVAVPGLLDRRLGLANGFALYVAFWLELDETPRLSSMAAIGYRNDVARW
jgi:hypothetical protein